MAVLRRRWLRGVEFFKFEQIWFEPVTPVPGDRRSYIRNTKYRVASKENFLATDLRG
jgi:hypothetical protein